MPISLLNRRSAIDGSNPISSKMLPDMLDESVIEPLPRQKLSPTPDNNDPVFDRFVSLAKRMFEVPIALVTIADIDCSWFKANTGLEGSIETIKESSFCACKFQRRILESNTTRNDFMNAEQLDNYQSLVTYHLPRKLIE